MKIALGGALFSMSSHVTTVAEAGLFAEKMLAAATDLGLDGMDLDVEDGGAGVDVQVGIVVVVVVVVEFNKHAECFVLLFCCQDN